MESRVFSYLLQNTDYNTLYVYLILIAVGCFPVLHKEGEKVHAVLAVSQVKLAQKVVTKE